MHLSSITIKGFKSFPERTKLVFSPGVSVIVGPNGCGKSNVTDAVLWALGEQSPLSVRGQTMQDMVYAGGEGVGPSRYAEVEVVLDNDGGEGEFSEISITRRLERGGEGSYRLNGARARLADVIETLADANLGREMHSVISQGRVEEIVLSAPRDRRLLVEEAAGLGKHRKRRRRAQLKLERTQDNLDRALDVEREARSRLRPLKRQAQAADIHARLEREAAELRARLLASELHSQEADLATAERDAATAREARAALDAKLAEVNHRRTGIEERLAERDRERTESWGRLTAVRAAHERLTVRAEALAARRAELAGALDRRRAALGAMADELTGANAAGSEDDPIGVGLDRIEEELHAAIAALGAARADPAGRGAEIARLRDASARAAQIAGRVEELLGSGRQDSLADRVEREAALLAALTELCEAAADARDGAGERAAALEQRMLGEGGGDDVTDALRACSREEAELQAKLRAAGETVTAAEVRVAHLGDRRAEAAGELERVAAVLGREIEAAPEPLEQTEREQIELKLERLARRREQLGPVNPLAEREYEEALAHVESLESQRTDLETALSELQSLIRDTDRKIHAAFEDTFEATRTNFEELVEHLFPGGRGRLRLVDDARGPKPVLGGAEQPAAEDDAAAGPGALGAAAGAQADAETEPEHEDAGDEFASQGVEIEVTPAGKATRRLSLLSGGEKALVALAFVFAVFLARPSPFYILDEVEAALDDANIDRFLQLIRRFSDRAQFIIVTHQKRTMDAADVLYGVSMGRGGVTKVVSRRFEHEQAALGESAEAA
jgi:chromosome segregation ATPase